MTASPETVTGPRAVHRGRFAAILTLLITLALASGVIASAAGLGGLQAQGLGAATVSTKTLSSLDLHWDPQWHQGSWRVGGVRLTSAADRGFQAGDTIELTVQAGQDACEVSHAVTAAQPSVSLTGEQFAGCAVTDDATVAVSVKGVDGASTDSSIGELRGSLAAFSAPLARPGRTLSPQTDTTVSGQQEQITALHLDVPGAGVSDVVGGSLVVVLPGTGQASGVISTTAGAPVVAQADGHDGVRITMSLEDPWLLEGSAELHAALSTPQHLAGADQPGAISMASWTETESDEPGEDPEQPEDPEPTPPPDPVDSALDAAGLTPGLSYDHTWRGEYTNGLGYQHTFTVTNTSSSTLTDWAIQFDTTLPPLWGADPTAPGAVELVWPLQTREYDRSSGLWTIGIPTATDRTLQPGESRNFSYHAHQISVPEVDPALFDTTITVGGHDHDVTFDVEVTTSSPFYVPWSLEVDLADYVCADSLQGRSVTFSQVVATPVQGSSTRYLIEGTPGDTQLVRAGDPREFTFARFDAGAPGWQQPCSEVG